VADALLQVARFGFGAAGAFARYENGAITTGGNAMLNALGWRRPAERNRARLQRGDAQLDRHDARIALRQRVEILLTLARQPVLQLGDLARIIRRPRGNLMGRLAEDMAQHVDFAEDAVAQFVRHAGMGKERPVGAGNAAGIVFGGPQRPEALRRGAASDLAHDAFVALLEQLVGGAGGGCFERRLVHEVAVDVVGGRAGRDADRAAFGDL